MNQKFLGSCQMSPTIKHCPTRWHLQVYQLHQDLKRETNLSNFLWIARFRHIGSSTVQNVWRVKRPKNLLENLRNYLRGQNTSQSFIFDLTLGISRGKDKEKYCQKGKPSESLHGGHFKLRKWETVTWLSFLGSDSHNKSKYLLNYLLF